MLKILLAMVALVSLSIVGSLTAIAEDKQATMDAIYVPVGRLALAPPVGVIPKRSAVTFPHSRHFDYTCKTCHHKWDGQSAVQSCTTSDCHDQQTAPPMERGVRYLAHIDDSISYFKLAYHRQCIGCHKEIKARNEKLAQSVFMLNIPPQKTGPIGCIDCHPRE